MRHLWSDVEWLVRRHYSSQISCVESLQTPSSHVVLRVTYIFLESICQIFGTLITKSIGHWQVFLFSHLTYLVQLLYLGKLSRPIYQQKLNKILKISQEDVILIKNLYLSKQYGARRLLNELADKGWKVDENSCREQLRLQCPLEGALRQVRWP